jgi:hypothetical protein
MLFEDFCFSAYNDLGTQPAIPAAAIQHIVFSVGTTTIYGDHSQFCQLWLHKSNVSRLDPLPPSPLNPLSTVVLW